MTSDELANKFLSHLLANFFPNIQSEAGQQFVKALAEYVIDCYGNVLKNCPNDFNCFAIHFMADTLARWEVKFGKAEDYCDGDSTNEDGSVTILEPAGNQAITYLKSKSFGTKKCEFGLIAKASQRDQWELKWREIYDDCKVANIPIFGGTYKQRPPKGGCCDV